MAKQEERKQSRVLEILTTEYPADRIALIIMGALVTVVGYYLLSGDRFGDTGPVLAITNTTSWWTSWIFGNDTGILIFSIVLTAIGVFAMGFGAWPYFQPSFKEMKRVSWPNGATIRNHTARVFGFIMVVAFMFVIYTWMLNPLFDWLKGL